MKNGVLILHENGVIEDCIDEDQFTINGGSREKVQYYNGALCPGFINTHCHLELSFLKGSIRSGEGMASFIRQLLVNRFQYKDDEMQQSYADGEALMIKNGIVAVGDISNNESTLYIKQKGRLYYHTFVEVMGFDSFEAGKIMEKGQELMKKFASVPAGNSSIVPHAPYSVSPALFSRIKEACYSDDQPLSIHMQESKDEIQFTNDHSGPLAALFDQLNFDYKKIQPWHARPIRAILPQLPTCNRLLLVHNTFTTTDEIQWAESINKNIYWTLCPKANLYIENHLPDIPSFVSENVRITLGTDSLASNDTLSIIDEMKAVNKHYPELTLDIMLPWATFNGAKALGIENLFGSFEKGKTPGVVLVDQNNYAAKRLL